MKKLYRNQYKGCMYNTSDSSPKQTSRFELMECRLRQLSITAPVFDQDLFECPCIDTPLLYPLSSLASQALSWNRHRDLHGMNRIGGKLGFLYG